MNAYCNHAGIGLIPWAPLADGQLARPLGAADTKRSSLAKGTIFERKQTDADKEIISRVEKFAKEKGWTMSQVALAWIGTKVSSPIVGISSVSFHALLLRVPSEGSSVSSPKDSKMPLSLERN